jgi:hypothetical protein
MAAPACSGKDNHAERRFRRICSERRANKRSGFKSEPDDLRVRFFAARTTAYFTRSKQQHLLATDMGFLSMYSHECAIRALIDQYEITIFPTDARMRS